MTTRSRLVPCEPLPLLMHIDCAEGKAGAAVLLPAQGPDYSDLPKMSPLWAEDGSCYNLCGLPPAHLQMY